MNKTRAAVPGLLFCLIGAAVSFGVDAVIERATGISVLLLVAIILGSVVGNVRPVSPRLLPGVAVASRTVLKVGVALLGLGVPAATVLALGWPVLVVAVLTVTLGFAATALLAPVFGLRRQQALLIGAGCSICGAAAIGAVDGVLTKKKEHEFVTAIAVIALLGTILLALAPVIGHLAGWDPRQEGIFIGISVHEVSQVVAAGGIAGAAVLPIAVTVKLGRILLLAPMMMIIAALERRHAARAAADGDTSVVLPPLVPAFVAAFIVLVAVRTLVPLPEGLIDGVGSFQHWMFAAAMFAQGTGVTVATIRTAGVKPFLFGLAITLVVIAAGVAGALLA
ncbi:putative sulfate exporter family transporter [Corynebacterium sp. CCM 8835]|uniref:Sulfate exporter family transporter n=1 Tax=Corynebacterium antarcticum TaxID=2800405 RepID=A0A9Q4GMB1_9CORY|nr:putative sulfate exporter family transporter [Corynebacterium antarcticum]MCK7641972.1 putative sulfate exporter family transporter [Corynebacterium antarcticum]MCK7659925.1 putative sulfate exporter family transporter [Corynebacterium antarcticum]MCL0245196.1 putative sulfate exporter family transporter [Corynebacterium antarcticum]MCX7492967.1 putative sulfate exporter family transporter [Corynebacterium antarcticum]MCX7537596.1 putative sulfate exporter family transporter [Corynebacteriu